MHEKEETAINKKCKYFTLSWMIFVTIYNNKFLQISQSEILSLIITWNDGNDVF